MKKIKDFGSRYSLYEINPKYDNDKLSLQEKRGHVSYKKVTSDEYTIQLSHVSKNTSLVFLDPYFPNWEIVARDKQSVKGITHSKIYNYANVWNIHTDALISSLPESDYKQNSDGTVDLSVTLLFKKSALYPITIYISIVTYAVIIGYGFVMLILYLRRKFKK